MRLRPIMQLLVRDPAYTQRLASFLSSLGQNPVVCGPDHVELDHGVDEGERLEMEIYLGVWRVLYPEAEVDLPD
jgi:hypothetical protein